jgi:hypothetical protein
MKRVLIVSDLHVGSNAGLMPEKVCEETADGDVMTHRPSAGQRRLRSLWGELVRKVGGVDIMVINGDAVDGPNRRGSGMGCWTTNIDLQAECATTLCKMFKADRYIVTQGSGYHTGENPSGDAMVADKLGAQFGTEIALKLKDDRIRLHFSHSIGVSQASWQYRTTPIARELVSALLNEKEYGKFHGVIRSHAHYYCGVEFGSHFGIITPCWQLRTPYMTQKGLALLPKLGAVVLDIDKGDVAKERYLWNVRKPLKEVVA